MRGTIPAEELLFDLEIEKTIRKKVFIKKKKKVVEDVPQEIRDQIRTEAEEQLRAEYARSDEERLRQALRDAEQAREQEEANRSLKDITAPVMSYDYPGSIAPQGEVANNFELRPAFINLVSQHQYGGSVNEDPHAHLERFIRHCNTMRVPNVPNEYLRLQLFPFSLRDAAEEWLHSQPQGSITTWEDLAQKFTTKFFPRALLRKMKNDIMTFTHVDSENMYEALERFKKLLRKCPQHSLTLAQQVDRFYDGLSDSARANMDAAANGEFDALPAQRGWDVINNMAARAMNSSSDRQNRRGVMEIGAYDRMVESNKKLSMQMAAMQQQFQAVK